MCDRVKRVTHASSSFSLSLSRIERARHCTNEPGFGDTSGFLASLTTAAAKMIAAVHLLPPCRDYYLFVI
jgi:hypothetical protein